MSGSPYDRAMGHEVTHTDNDGADQIRSCTRKKGYPSESVARMAIDTIRSMSPDADVRVYGCRHCGQWHVGGSPGSARARAEADSPARPRGIGKPPRRRAYGDRYGTRPRRLERTRHVPEDDL